MSSLSDPWNIQAHLDKIIAAVNGVTVAINHLTLQIQRTMTPQIVQALIDAINSLVALINTKSTDLAAAQAATTDAQNKLAALQATDAALQNPELTAAAQAAVAAALAAIPSPGTVTAPDPTPSPAPVPTA